MSQSPTIAAFIDCADDPIRHNPLAIDNERVPADASVAAVQCRVLAVAMLLPHWVALISW
jgi:hypothetical protein